MPNIPKNSPWGKVQYGEKLAPGVYDVSTAGHGGIMVKSKTAEKILSPAARKEGFKEKGFLCFEEDTQSAVVERELLDKGLWKGPKRFEDIADYEAILNDSLIKCNPEYWQAREKAGKPSILSQTKENQELIKNHNNDAVTAKKDTVSL